MPAFFDSLASFGESPALVDRASGVVIPYSGLLDVLRKHEPADSGKPTLLSGSPDLPTALRLLAVLAAGRVVAPLSPRLPATEVRRRGERISLRIEPGNAATILFTSGSSGTAKAVWHDLESHVRSAKAASSRIPLGPGCGWVLSLPFHHVSGLAILIRCLFSGAAVVFPDRNQPLIQQLNDPLASHASLVAVQLQRLVESKAQGASLQAVLCGGGPFSEPLVRCAINSGIPLHLTYGMTEAASQITTSQRLTHLQDLLHVGHALPGSEVALSATGEILVKSPSLARLILRGQREWLHPCDADGWFPTGDAGVFAPGGELVVLGRCDRMLISSGENIHPECIEQLLSGVEKIRRAVVVAVPDKKYGQRPAAFISGDVEVSTLREFLSASLESFAVPDHFYPWPDGVPADTEKIDYKYFEALAVGQIGGM